MVVKIYVSGISGNKEVSASGAFRRRSVGPRYRDARPRPPDPTPRAVGQSSLPSPPSLYQVTVRTARISGPGAPDNSGTVTRDMTRAYCAFFAFRCSLSSMGVWCHARFPAVYHGSHPNLFIWISQEQWLSNLLCIFYTKMFRYKTNLFGVAYLLILFVCRVYRKYFFWEYYYHGNYCSWYFTAINTININL